MLPLSEIQQWHHSSFLVLWGVAFQDLLDELVILLRELEWDASIIVGRVTMLIHAVRNCVVSEVSFGAWFIRLTTWSASLDNLVLATNDRHWGREAMRADRKAGLNTYGESLDAIVAVGRRNGDLEVASRSLSEYCRASASI